MIFQTPQMFPGTIHTFRYKHSTRENKEKGQARKKAYILHKQQPRLKDIFCKRANIRWMKVNIRHAEYNYIFSIRYYISNIIYWKVMNRVLCSNHTVLAIDSFLGWIALPTRCTCGSSQVRQVGPYWERKVPGKCQMIPDAPVPTWASRRVALVHWAPPRYSPCLEHRGIGQCTAPAALPSWRGRCHCSSASTLGEWDWLRDRGLTIAVHHKKKQ